MKYFLLLFLTHAGLMAWTQSFTLGDQASLHLSDGAYFFFGGDATLNGPVTNHGFIIAYNDLDFGDNESVNNLKFVGPKEQKLSGDTLHVNDLHVEKVAGSNLTLLTSQVRVTGNLTLENGTIRTDDAADLILTGGNSAPPGNNGYVERDLTARVNANGDPLTFPMGIAGHKNYITIRNARPGVVINVKCRQPEPASLLPDGEMVGIADEVEWIVTAYNDSIGAQVSVDYSGVDLLNFSNGDMVRANKYDPAIVLFSEADSIYHALNSETVNTTTAQSPQGSIVSDETVALYETPRRFAIALIPVQTGPVFFVPNSFTPNASHEENRVFRPYFSGADISNISISVFDSFNNEIYTYQQSGETLDISQSGWDGLLSSGLEAPDGVYYFSIKVIAESQVYSKSGSVLLMK